MPGTPRHARVALALALAAAAPRVVDAQPVTRTWNGCDQYICATYTFQNTGSSASGYSYNGFGTFTVQPALAAAGYQTLRLAVCVGDCPPETQLGQYGLAGQFSLVGRAAGDVIAFSTGPITLQGGNSYYDNPTASITGLGASYSPPPSGYFIIDQGFPLTLVSTVATPEPSTVALTLGGLAAVGGVARRRRRPV